MAIQSRQAQEARSVVQPARTARTRAKREKAPAYINRELSWLDFNSRVQALAENHEAPVLSRAKFLAIVSQNLDEFFQVRVAALKEQVGAGVRTTAPDGMTPIEQLKAIRK